LVAMTNDLCFEVSLATVDQLVVCFWVFTRYSRYVFVISEELSASVFRVTESDSVATRPRLPWFTWNQIHSP
jgi:hypothetical protein